MSSRLVFSRGNDRIEDDPVLTADEQARLMPLLMALSADDVPVLAADLKSKSIDEIVVLVRSQLGAMAKA